MQENDRITARMEQLEKDNVEKHNAVVDLMAQDKCNEVTAAVSEVHKQRAAEVRTCMNHIDMQKTTIRE